APFRPSEHLRLHRLRGLLRGHRNHRGRPGRPAPHRRPNRSKRHPESRQRTQKAARRRLKKRPFPGFLRIYLKINMLHQKWIVLPLTAKELRQNAFKPFSKNKGVTSPTGIPGIPLVSTPLPIGHPVPDASATTARVRL